MEFAINKERDVPSLHLFGGPTALRSNPEVQNSDPSFVLEMRWGMKALWKGLDP